MRHSLAPTRVVGWEPRCWPAARPLQLGSIGAIGPARWAVIAQELRGCTSQAAQQGISATARRPFDLGSGGLQEGRNELLFRPLRPAIAGAAALGWQPSRFLSDRAEAERAFALAEELGSVNAAAAELGITWPSLRKAFARHGLGMPARNPEAVRQRAIAAATQRAGQPTAPTLDPVFVALNQGQLPAARGPHGEHGVRLRRGEEIETLSYRTVVELNAESRLSPQRRVATIAHRPKRAQRLAEERTGRSDRRQVQRAARTDAASSPAGRSRRRGDADRCPISPHPARAD
jgi:hypothetical protein